MKQKSIRITLRKDWQEMFEWMLCNIAQGFCEPVIKPNQVNGILNEFFKRKIKIRIIKKVLE